MSIRLERACLRLLWRSIADAAQCTCVPGEPCPECEAASALGLGRWDSGIEERMARLASDRPDLSQQLRGEWSECERRARAARDDHDFVGDDCDCALCGEGWCHYLHAKHRERVESE